MRKKSIFLVITLMYIPTIVYTSVPIADAYCALGTAFYRAGNQSQAIDNYAHALEYCPEHLDATIQLGTLYFEKKQYAQARTYLEQCAKHSPKNEEATIMLAHCYTALEHYVHAIDMYSHLVLLNPRRVDLFFYRAQCHKKKKNYIQSLEDIERFLYVFPNDKPARMLKVQVLIELGYYGEADDMLAQLPESYTKLLTKAHLYRIIGKPMHAIELYQKAHTINPKDRSYLLGLSYSYLLAGNRRKGYEIMKEYALHPANQQHLLESIDKIPGKRIFIGAEIMLDSMIQHIRYAKYIYEHGGTVIVQAPEPLADILRTQKYIDHVVDISIQQVPAYDYYIPAIVLPWLFDSYAPDTIPYLKADNALKNRWQSCIAHTNNKKKIGICWHLNEAACNITQKRIVPTKALNDLFTLDRYTFVALYSKHFPPDLSELQAHTQLITMCGAGFSETSHDLQQLIALIDTMDIIITVDSTLAHLAGALGKQVYLLLPYYAHWRWEQEMHSSSRSPSCSSWYPTITIIRQEKPGEWDNAIKKLIEIL